MSEFPDFTLRWAQWRKWKEGRFETGLTGRLLFSGPDNKETIDWDRDRQRAGIPSIFD